MTLGVVILAAGASRRMGQPKLLLPWGKNTIMGALIAQWQSLGAAQIAVVCAANDEPMQIELDQLSLPPANRLINPDPARGMFSSIQCAARWDGWSTAITDWGVVLGDQPHLGGKTLRALLEFKSHNPGRICQPSFRGRLKHPVILPRKRFLELRQTAKNTLHEFLQSYAKDVASVPLDDPGLALDLDAPADYELAVKLYAQKL